MPDTLLNQTYIREGGANTGAAPDCGHLDPPCGILCDRRMVATRHGGVLTDLASQIATGGFVLYNFAEGHEGMRSQVKEALRDFSLERVAAAMSLGVQDVVNLLSNSQGQADSYVQMDRMLRDGCASYRDVRKATGVDAKTVESYANLIGRQSTGATNLRAGGGLKYSREQYDQVVRLRKQGMTYQAIAEATGLPSERVGYVCRTRVEGKRR